MPTGIYTNEPIRKSIYYNDACPCCKLRREVMRQKNVKHRDRVRRSRSISEEELERKLNDYFERERVK